MMIFKLADLLFPVCPTEIPVEFIINAACVFFGFENRSESISSSPSVAFSSSGAFFFFLEMRVKWSVISKSAFE